MPPYKNSFDWQRKFAPAIKRILGEHLIAEAPIEEDQQRNTDFMVLTLAAVRVACRIRSYEPYATRYPNEFTIRSERPRTGYETELAKILRGFGDYFFYGFATPNDDGLAGWMLGRLDEFRLWHHYYVASNGGRLPGIERPNGDGSSKFRAYQLSDLRDTKFLVNRKPVARSEAA